MTAFWQYLFKELCSVVRQSHLLTCTSLFSDSVTMRLRALGEGLRAGPVLNRARESCRDPSVLAPRGRGQEDPPATAAPLPVTLPWGQLSAP